MISKLNINAIEDASIPVSKMERIGYDEELCKIYYTSTNANGMDINNIQEYFGTAKLLEQRKVEKGFFNGSEQYLKFCLVFDTPVTYIPSSAFTMNSSCTVGEITFPSSIYAISSDAFMNFNCSVMDLTNGTRKGLNNCIPSNATYAVFVDELTYSTIDRTTLSSGLLLGYETSNSRFGNPQSVAMGIYAMGINNGLKQIKVDSASLFNGASIYTLPNYMINIMTPITNDKKYSIGLPSIGETGISFKIGSTAPAISLVYRLAPGSIGQGAGTPKWANDKAPVFEPNKAYEIIISNGVASWTSYTY